MRADVIDLPAEAQYHRLSFVKLPKYFSMTILPFFNIIMPLELVDSK
jgi:hypothetical protein